MRRTPAGWQPAGLSGAVHLLRDLAADGVEARDASSGSAATRRPPQTGIWEVCRRKPSDALLQFGVAMGDLYADDITSETAYPTGTLLQDIRNLIASGQREGPLLDYKADISPKDNWPETVAAFANTFGGVIIFGVEGQADQPRRLTGYDPKGVEMKTRLGSTILSRIQPRPDIDLRVLNHDADPTKEVAVLRVSEGTHPPYMHNKGEERRIYVRTGAQKAEADYLQLNALYDKRRHTVPSASVSTTDLTTRS